MGLVLMRGYVQCAAWGKRSHGKMTGFVCVEQYQNSLAAVG